MHIEVIDQSFEALAELNQEAELIAGFEGDTNKTDCGQRDCVAVAE